MSGGDIELTQRNGTYWIGVVVDPLLHEAFGCFSHVICDKIIAGTEPPHVYKSLLSLEQNKCKLSNERYQNLRQKKLKDNLISNINCRGWNVCSFPQDLDGMPSRANILAARSALNHSCQGEPGVLQLKVQKRAKTRNRCQTSKESYC